MKRFISMTMAAMMAVSIVPSTAFAANEEIAKIKTVGAIEWNVEDGKKEKLIENVELQIDLKDFSHSYSRMNEEFEFELEFEGAHAFSDNDCFDFAIYRKSECISMGENFKLEVDSYEKDDTSFDFTLTENNFNLLENDKIVLVFKNLEMKRYTEGAKATVSVYGDFGEVENLPVAAVVGNGFKLDYSSKLTKITEESEEALKTITIKSRVGAFSEKDEIKVELNNNFEISKLIGTMIEGGIYKEGSLTEKSFIITPFANSKEITIKGMVIEALENAKPDSIATIKVKCKNYDAITIDVAKVIGEDIEVTIDENKDIPVIYSGTDSDYKNLNYNESHNALTVTIEETAPGSWDAKDKWSLALPEGVYVTNKSEFKAYNTNITDVNNFFGMAYADSKKGNFESFEFGRRSFTINDKEKAKFEIKLNLVADPTFEGDVNLIFDNGEYQKSVTIAKFEKPYKIEAKQNDVKIDYRYTKLDSGIIVKEPVEDLWNSGTKFNFTIEHNIKFEKGEKYTSNFEVKGDNGSAVEFVTKERSDEEPFIITINELSTYMDRNLAAGGYDLIVETSIDDKLMDEHILGTNKKYKDICDYENEKIENFVNIITSGDSTFITKVEVPVDKDYIKAGDKVFTLDVPAYINADNYTMLPVRAVAIALGIDNDAIVWNAETHTATIFYGSRIISMTVGANVMTVNGTAIPTATSVEVVNGRMFIPMRDLATAMNAKLDWDPVTRTAYFN